MSILRLVQRKREYLLNEDIYQIYGEHQVQNARKG